MTLLLDVNVLVAVAWPSHADHTRARAWFTGLRGGELVALGVADTTVRMQPLLRAFPVPTGADPTEASTSTSSDASLAARAKRYAKALTEDEIRPAT